MRRLTLAILVACALLIAVPATASAAQIYAAMGGSDALGDGSLAKPYATPSYAATLANIGDEVVIGPGVFLDGNITLSSGVTLTGQGAGVTIIDAASSGPAVVASNITGGAIRGITFKNGSGYPDPGRGATGGAVYLLNSAPTITDCAFADGKTQWGGAIAAINPGGLTITNCSFSGNEAFGGGAIWIQNGTANLTGCTFTANHAESGGAVNSEGSDVASPPSVVINSSTFTGNSAHGSGGAVYGYQSNGTVLGSTFSDNSVSGNDGGAIDWSWCPTFALTGSTFTNNSTGNGGGAVNARSSVVTIEHNAFTGNRGGYGGALCLTGSTVGTVVDNAFTSNSATNYSGAVQLECAADLKRNTITNNSSAWGGGAIGLSSSGARISECTITGNTGLAGSAISDYSGTAVFTNCVIAGNSGSTAGVVRMEQSSSKFINCTITDNDAGLYAPSSTPTITNCVIWNNGDDLIDCTATYSDISNGDAGVGNISADPMFASLVSRDYRLRVGSPCIDAADPAVAPAIDFAGIARPQGVGFDMGAHEYSSSSPLAGVGDPSLSSPTHTVRAWSKLAAGTVAFNWPTGTPANLAGYGVSVTKDAPAIAPHTNSLAADATEYAFTAPADGAWYINVASVDTDGTWSDGTSYGPIWVDTEGPAITHDAPSGWQNANVIVAVSFSDAGSGLGARGSDISGGAFLDYQNPWPTERFSFDTEGMNWLTYGAWDRAGNYSYKKIDVWIDKTAPESTVEIPATMLGSADITVTATDTLSGVDAIHWILDGGAEQTGGKVHTAVAGAHTLTYWAVDNAGNAEDRTTVDFTVAPSAVQLPTDPILSSLTHPVSTWTSNRVMTIDVAWPTPSPSPITQFRVSLTENAAGSAMSGSAVSGDALRLERSDLADGVWYYNLVSGDANGAWSAGTSYGPIWVDGTAPETTSTVSPSPGSTSVTLGATDALSGVAATHWKLDSGAEQTGTDVYSDVVGSHSLEYWSVDAAGNAEPHTTVTFTVMPAGPDAPTGIRYTLRGSKTLVTWTGAARATGYAVRVNGKLVKTLTAPTTSTLLPMILGPKDQVLVESTGVSAQSSQAVRGGYVFGSWSRIGSIGFKAGSSALNSTTRWKLRTLAARIAASGFTRVRVDGYTSARYPGSIDERRQLSAARAAAVKKYLLAQLRLRHSSATVITAAHGSADPVAPNNSEHNAAKNRRAEVSVR